MGGRPFRVAVDPTTRTACVTLGADDTVWVIDEATDRGVAGRGRLPAGDHRHGAPGHRVSLVDDVDVGAAGADRHPVRAAADADGGGDVVGGGADQTRTWAAKSARTGSA
jgi:hypothetical protein